MTLRLISPPTAAVLTLAEIKEHARVDDTADDVELERLRVEVEAEYDGDGELGRALTTQTWELVLDEFRDEILVPLPPFQSVPLITYIDGDGATQTLSAAVYHVAGIGGTGQGRIVRAYDRAWPYTRRQPEAVVVRFVAGYGDAGADVPKPIRAALLEIIAHRYRYREAIAQKQMAMVPKSAADGLIKYRVWSAC